MNSITTAIAGHPPATLPDPLHRHTCAVFSFEPVDQHLDSRYCRQLRTILIGVAAEGVMDLDANKEWAYVGRAVRRRGTSRAASEPQRWALVEDGLVVGYISGRLRGGIPSCCDDLARAGLGSGDREIGAFISMVIIPSDARGRGCGRRGVREFAGLARKGGATHVGLRLDTTGEVTSRRKRFERMGFEFDGLLGTASVEDLLA